MVGFKCDFSLDNKFFFSSKFLLKKKSNYTDFVSILKQLFFTDFLDIFGDPLPRPRRTPSPQQPIPPSQQVLLPSILNLRSTIRLQLPNLSHNQTQLQIRRTLFPILRPIKSVWRSISCWWFRGSSFKPIRSSSSVWQLLGAIKSVWSSRSWWFWSGSFEPVWRSQWCVFGAFQLVRSTFKPIWSTWWIRRKGWWIRWSIRE